MLDFLVCDVIWVLIGKDGMVNIVLFSQIQQMIVNIVRSKEFLKDLFRIRSEFILSDKLAIFQKAFFENLITILVINGSLLA